jgi:hypothetical protein
MDISAARELADLAQEMWAHEREEDAGEWQARFGARATDLSAAVDALLGAGLRSQAHRLVGSLSYFCQDAGRVDEGRALAERVVDGAGGMGATGSVRERG